MSGTPNKRLHDDHSRYPPHTQDDSGGIYSNSKLPNPSLPIAAAGTGAVSFDIGQDSRMPKVPRTDLDSRRSPMLQMYRMQQPPSSSSMNDSQIDHPVNNPDDRVESRDNNVGNIKADTRDVKAESKELLYQSGKIDKDVRYANRGDDHKDAKYERDLSYSEYRNETKTDKDSYNPVNSSHVNWKDSKEHTRAWKYPDTAPSGGNLEQWHASRANNMEIASKNLATEAKDHTDVKVDDRDRKRKDGKHREWGENSKERTEIRNSEMKDPTKEERETDRKDLLKDKDKTRDSKDPIKRDPWIGNEKEGLQNVKEDMDISSSKAMDHEEQKKPKTAENWKDLDKESKEKRMEKDIDKDSDDGGADVEGSTDREREAFNHGVQQRKRMLRPRGSPQVANRDPRFRSRPQDNDGSTGKADVSTVVYRVGECMQELIKLWKEYESSISDQMSESSKTGPTLEIRIPAEHVSATNRQVKGGQLWGTDIYTDDSDLVAVLMHTGYCRPTASPPPPAIQELRATVRVLPPQDCYVSTLRNNVRSRAWGAAIGCSFRVERCYIVKKGGGTIDLEACLTHTSTVEPTLAPVVVERTMTTRAAASNALRQQRFVREVTLQYNLCNEPWIKYSISAIADKGLKKPLFTSARLKKGEVLYLESRTRRYELCFNGEKMVKATAGNDMEVNGVESDNNNNYNGNSNLMDVFRWSECKKPLPQTVMRSIGIPLPPEHLQVLEENLDWEDIQWSQIGVWISGKEYPLSRVHFLSPV